MQMKYNLYLSVALMLLTAVGGWAQTTVSGNITDEDGSPLIGVNILEQGTANGTVTDLDGTYSIVVSTADAVLIYSYTGFSTQSVTVGDRTVIDITLRPGVELQEVVVTSLGIEREKRRISYAAQNVDTRNIAQARELNVANSIAGKVAGVDLVRSSAGVGSASRVTIRGNRSITGNNQPLYIIDGVPMSNTAFSNPNSDNGGVQSGDGIGNINPDDIENITVLKGPNAVAIYGARANNGAVVITTKKGVARKGIGVEFNFNNSIDRPLILTKFQNVYGQGNGGVYIPSSEEGWGARMDGQLVDHWTNNPNFEGPSQYAYSPHNNFEDFFVTGYNLANSLTLTTGSEDVRALFSYTNTNSRGIVETNELRRHNFNLRLDGNLSKRLSFDAKLTYFNQQVDNRLATGDDFNNPMRAIYRQPSSISLEQVKEFEFFDDLGNRRQHYWNPGTNGGENVYWMLNRTKRDENRNRVIGMGMLRYQIADGLSFMLRSSFDQVFEDQSYMQYNDTYTIADAGNLNLDDRRGVETNNDFLINYNRNIGSSFSIDASVGGNILYQRQSTLNTRTNRLLKPNLFVITNTSQINSSQGGWEKEVHSLYGFASIGYKDFLYLDITGRNDWSSTLPADNRSYFYPSVGLTWIITDMLRIAPDFLTFAKIRASYAEVGSDTDPYRLSQIFNFGAGGVLGYAWKGSSLPALELRPENTESVELGFDVRLFSNRLGIDFTWYKSNTFDQLLSIPLPRPSGFSSKFINAGNIQNKGVEVVLSATPLEGRDFTWDLMVNFASNENIAIELTDDLKEFTTRGRSWMTTHAIIEGEVYDQILTRGFERNEQGRILINDLGLPLTTPGQTVPQGSAAPDWTGGLTNNLSYKGLTLSALIDVRSGGKVFSFTEANLTFDGYSAQTLEGRDGFVVDGVLASDGSENTIVTTAEAYWHALGGRNSPIGEPYGYDASFIRLREIVLGYTFDLKSDIVQDLSVSLYGRNLGFLYNASEIIDPGMSIGVSNIQGVEGFAVPTTSTFGLNVNVKL